MTGPGAALAPARASGIDPARVVEYVRSRQTPDGGFFFARVPPSTVSDTYFALASLDLLGEAAADPEAARRWVVDAATADYLAQPRALWQLVEAGRLAGVERPVRASWAARALRLESPGGGFAIAETLDVEVASELEATSFAVALLDDYGIPFDREGALAVVKRVENADGGYGRDGRSTYASTCFALLVLRRLAGPPAPSAAAVAWLRRHDAIRERGYLEDAWWWATALRAAGAQPPSWGRLAAFIRACWHPSGGFSRGVNGIPALEHTWMALDLLAQSAG